MTLANITDEINPDIRVNDRFSLRRVGELYAYYGPTISRQCIIYFALSLLCSVLLIMPAHEALQFAIFTAAWTMLSFMFLLAPCAFGRHGASQIIERLIPAKASEKMVFFLSYTLVVIPIIVYTLPYAARWLYLNIPTVQTEGVMDLYRLQMSVPATIFCVNTLTTLAGVLTCLITVMMAKSNRVLKGIAAVLIVNFTTGIIGGIYGITNAFSAGFKDGISGNVNSCNQEALVSRIMDEMSQASAYLISVYALFFIYIIGIIWLMHRTLKRRNL